MNSRDPTKTRNSPNPDYIESYCSEDSVKLEDNLLKIERVLSINEEMGKLKQDQRELKLREFERRFVDFQMRINYLEERNSDLLSGLGHQIYLTQEHLEGITELPLLKRDIDELQNNKRHCQLGTLEEKLNEKMMEICDTIEELIKSSTEKDEEIYKLGKEIESVEKERNSTVDLLKREIESIVRLPNTRRRSSIRFSVDVNMYEEEEYFLSNIGRP